MRSRFAIEPLQPGFGYTLGNALRRTLLSSIPGAAISSVKIDGVLHEFSTIPKVTADVTDGDIQPPAGVEILNPELHLATLGRGAGLELEVVVQRGVGYVPAER